jgi:predicted metal-dependent phosphoesterase TrpH
MKRIKVAIHLHTDYSFDSNIPPEALVEHAEREGVDVVAVTDHDTVDGALAVRNLDGVRVIVGEEISSCDGHILGLFLEETIPPGLSGSETIERIHDQGGLALAAHPLATLCRDSLQGALASLSGLLDGIEIHNAQNPLPWEDWRAARFARKRGLPGFAGCDTHVRGRLAPAWQVMPAFSTPAEFLERLRDAELHLARFGPRYYAQMGLRHVWDCVASRPLSEFGRNARPAAGRTPRGRTAPAARAVSGA